MTRIVDADGHIVEPRALGVLSQNARDNILTQNALRFYRLE